MIKDSKLKLERKREKAIEIIESKRIKLHRFFPSGREIWTAVGSDGDYLLDLSQPYCSCRDFHFRFLSNKDEECYHILALKMAIKSKIFDVIDFQDEEFTSFIQGLLEYIPY